MIKHLVLFKVKEGLTPESPEVQSVMTDANELHQLPMIKDWIFGQDFLRRPISYDFALLATFDNKADLQAYAQHPEHVAIIKRLLEVTTYIVCDIEV